MTSFCQEYNSLLNEFELLYSEAVTALDPSQVSPGTTELKDMLMRLKPSHQRLEDLLETTTTLEDGREIKQLERIILKMIENEIGQVTQSNNINIIDHKIVYLGLVCRKRLLSLTPLTLFKDLTSLSLQSTPIKSLSPLAKIKQLEGLSLYQTPIKDIDSLSDLINLQKLKIVEVPISNIHPIEKLINLNSLNIVAAPLRDINPIKSLTSLVDLNLNNCRIKNIDAIKSLMNLDTLTLTNTDVESLDAIIELKEKGGDIDTLFIGDTPVSKNPKGWDNIRRLKNMGIAVYA